MSLIIAILKISLNQTHYVFFYYYEILIKDNGAVYYLILKSILKCLIMFQLILIHKTNHD